MQERSEEISGILFSKPCRYARTLKIGLEKDDEQGCLAGLSVCLVSVFRFAACGECVSCKCKIGGFG